jgi:nitrate reductase assembly molybdenum cofactor insertion protein NarJ
MTPAAISPEIAQLLTEAAEWRLLGLLFEYPTADWRANLEALRPSLERPELRAIADAALEVASEGLHFALFGPAGTAPVREVVYLGGVQFGHLLAELAAYYEAFGYRPKTEEADDHFAVELGFFAFLKLKQANAALSGDTEAAQLTAGAAESFLKDHLAVQAEPVLRALENFAPQYLVDAGRFILNRTGPSPRSAYPLSSPLTGDEDSETMSCGQSACDDDLIQLQP